jgi:hypothetical protein
VKFEDEITALYRYSRHKLPSDAVEHAKECRHYTLHVCDGTAEIDFIKVFIYKYKVLFLRKCTTLQNQLHLNYICAYIYIYILCIYRVIHKSVKHFKNQQQIDYAIDHGNSYAEREREST